MKYFYPRLVLRSRSIRMYLCIAGCVATFASPHHAAMGQWKQSTGFSNSLGADQVNGFLSYGTFLLADASCPSDQPGATGDSLFVSRDDGLTWRDFAPNGAVPLIAVGSSSVPVLIGEADPTPNTFGARKILAYSTDAGQSWMSDTLAWPVENGLPMAMVPAGDTILIGTAVGVSQQARPGAPWVLDTVGMSAGGIFTD